MRDKRDKRMASITALLAYGAQQSKAKKKKSKATSKYQVSYKSTTSVDHYCTATTPTTLPLQAKPRDAKVLHVFEEAIRRRDFQQVLWLIANGDVAADHETVNGENAILAAVASKSSEALCMLIARYEKVQMWQL